MIRQYLFHLIIGPLIGQILALCFLTTILSQHVWFLAVPSIKHIYVYILLMNKNAKFKFSWFSARYSWFYTWNSFERILKCNAGFFFNRVIARSAIMKPAQMFCNMILWLQYHNTLETITSPFFSVQWSPSPTHYR